MQQHVYLIYIVNMIDIFLLTAFFSKSTSFLSPWLDKLLQKSTDYEGLEDF